MAPFTSGDFTDRSPEPIQDLCRDLSVVPHPDLILRRRVPLSTCTRFGLGGPAEVVLETADRQVLLWILRALIDRDIAFFVLGGGTNLIVSDHGYPGAVVRWSASDLRIEPDGLYAESGALLQQLVDRAAGEGLHGLESLAGIPGTVGGAIFGNAGAYGHSISERVAEVLFLDRQGVGMLSAGNCRFSYRSSRFKESETGVILGVHLSLEQGDAQRITEEIQTIRRIRQEKFPEEMRCAGSIFKNLRLRELSPEIVELIPPPVIREGKVPAAWFLEQIGAKGRSRGGIHVANYHANLIYHRDQGTADDLFLLLQELKLQVEDRFGIRLEEEVRYLGAFPGGYAGRGNGCIIAGRG